MIGFELHFRKKTINIAVENGSVFIIPFSRVYEEELKKNTKI